MTMLKGAARSSASPATLTGTSDAVRATPGFKLRPIRGAAARLHSVFGDAPAIILLTAADIAALFFSLGIALIVRLKVLPPLFPVFPPMVPENLTANLWWLPLVYTCCLAYEGLYTARRPFWRECSSLAKSTTLALLVTLTVVSLAKLSGNVSRTVIILAWLVSLGVLPALRYTIKNALVRTGLWRRRVLVLGAGKTGALVAAAFTREKYLGYEIVGYLDDDPGKKGGVRANGYHFPVLGGFRDAERLMQETGVRHLVVAAPGMQPQALVALVNSLQRQAASLTVIPDLLGVPVMGVEADYSFNERMLALRIRNNLASPLNRFIKRAFDLVMGTLILLAVLPLLAAIALAVKLDSPGPVIFAHRRIGRSRREFNCYKFRTMVVNAEAVLQEHLKKDPALRREWERDFKLKNDPRVTRVGRFLRATSLDELPQIFNVLKGEMSLVGPRPIVRNEVLRFGPYIDDFYLVRPGITGLWQVSGRNDIDYDDRVRLESWYVRNWSLWLDTTILIRTIGVVLSRRGAY